jgi:hypothetical protein
MYSKTNSWKIAPSVVDPPVQPVIRSPASSAKRVRRGQTSSARSVDWRYSVSRERRDEAVHEIPRLRDRVAKVEQVAVDLAVGVHPVPGRLGRARVDLQAADVLDDVGAADHQLGAAVHRVSRPLGLALLREPAHWLPPRW